MKVAPVADVKAKFSSYLKQCEKSPVVVTKNGYIKAALIPINDDDMERLSLAFNPKFQKILRDANERIEKTGGIPEKEFWKKLDS